MSLSELNMKTLKKDLNATSILLLFMVVVYPLLVLEGPLYLYSGPRYIILAIVGVTAFLIIYSNRINLRENAYIPLSLFMLFIFISSIMADDLAMSWIGNSYRYTGLSTYIFCVILFLIAGQHKQPQKVLMPMIACAVVVSIIGLMQYCGILYDQQDFWVSSFYRPRSTIGNANWLGTYLVFILPASVILFIVKKRYIWLVSTAFIYAGLLVTLTRGAWLAFAIIFFLITFLLYKQKKLKWNYGILVMALILVTALLLPVNDWNMLQRVYTTSDTIQETASLEGDEFREEVFRLPRTIYWLGSLESIKENWAFGVGPDQIKMELSEGYYRDKMHNFYLEIAVSMGLPALLAYLAFLSFFLRRQKNLTGFIMLIMVLTYMLQGFTIHDVVQVMPLYWIVLGLLWGNMNRAETAAVDNSALVADENSLSESEKEMIGKKNALLIKIIVIPLTIFALLISAWYYYPTEGTQEIPGVETYTGQLRGYTYHGYGLLETGSYVYEGYFRSGSFDGYGTLTYANSAQYIGEFKNGYFNGEGRMISKDGKIIEGVWERGQLLEKKNNQVRQLTY